MSVYRRKDSEFWYYEFEINGQRFRGSTKSKSEREAQAFERRKRSEAIAGIEARRTPGADTTVAEVFAKFWTDYGHLAKSAATNVTVMRRIIEHLDPNRRYSEVGIADVANFVRALKSRPRMSGATINRHLEIWRSVHNRALSVYELPVRPISWREVRQEQATERVRTMSAEEAKLLWSALPDHMQLMMEFAIATGLRKAQVFELQWRNVDLDAKTADVQRQKRKGGGRQIIKLSPWAITILMQAPRVGPYVFETTNFRKHWDAARRKAGIQDFRWHDLRHVFATWARKRGARLEAIMKQLGHSSIKVTMKYLAVGEEDVQDAVDRVGSFHPQIRPLQIPYEESPQNSPQSPSKGRRKA